MLELKTSLSKWSPRITARDVCAQSSIVLIRYINKAHQKARGHQSLVTDYHEGRYTSTLASSGPWYYKTHDAACSPKPQVSGPTPTFPTVNTPSSIAGGPKSLAFDCLPNAPIRAIRSSPANHTHPSPTPGETSEAETRYAHPRAAAGQAQA